MAEEKKYTVPQSGEKRTVEQKYGKHVFYQDFLMPDGKTSDFLLVEAGGTPAIVMPVTKDLQVIALRQFRYGANEMLIEFPGGNPKSHEHPEETLRSELMEETGCQPETIIRLAEKLYFEPAMVRTTYIPFLAKDCTYEHRPRPGKSEFFEVLLFSLDEWIAKIMKGEVIDSKTIAITFLALPHLGYKGLASAL